MRGSARLGAHFRPAAPTLCSGNGSPSAHTAPSSKCSFFQMGTVRLRVSINQRQASNAAARCAETPQRSARWSRQFPAGPIDASRPHRESETGSQPACVSCSSCFNAISSYASYSRNSVRRPRLWLRTTPSNTTAAPSSGCLILFSSAVVSILLARTIGHARQPAADRGQQRNLIAGTELLSSPAYSWFTETAMEESFPLSDADSRFIVPQHITSRRFVGQRQQVRAAAGKVFQHPEK